MITLNFIFMRQLPTIRRFKHTLYTNFRALNYLKYEKYRQTLIGILSARSENLPLHV
jgi:hypothetical protein